jgi:signal transduction histidine kinase
MTRAARVACAGAAVTLLLVAGGVVVGVMTPQQRLPEDLRPGPTWFLTPAYLLALAVVGAVISSRQPRNLIGWLMSAAAALGALMELGRSYSAYSLSSGHPGFIAVEWLAWLANWTWLPWLTLQMVYLPLLFPDGRLPSRRWAWLIWTASLTALVSVVSRALDPGLLGALRLHNPAAIADPAGNLRRVAGLATVVLVTLGLASLASVFVRLRSATGDRSQQLKWFGSAIAVLVTLVAAQTIDDEMLEGSSPWLEALLSFAYLTIPFSIALSVLRFRLYDIDVVISRALVYGALASFISVVYLVAVVGVGALLGLGNHVNLTLSLLAAGVVALAFQPGRERLQRLANRIVYGRRATPYDALAVLSRRVAETAPSEVLLTEMVRTVCDALGVSSASLWWSAGQELRPAAWWPPGTQHRAASGLVSNGTGLCTLPVRHENRLLGAISVSVPPGRSLSSSDQRLLADVANQAGLVLRNLGLTADLMTRLEELRESRRRLVTVQVEERRRLERDLHDGAQQLLLGVRLGIREVLALLETDPAVARGRLEWLEQGADEALRTLRELARGVCPPLLTTKGLAAALSARARSLPIAVHLSADCAGRYPADLEAAVYFCCSEALQNVVRHARASSVTVRLSEEGRELLFVIEDDGQGFDLAKAVEGSGLQSMRDRMDVAGGSLEIVSRQGGGTRVQGRVELVPSAGAAIPPRSGGFAPAVGVTPAH